MSISSKKRSNLRRATRAKVTPAYVELATLAGSRMTVILAHASSAARGRDGTRYSRSPPENYLSHRLAAVVSNAVLHDAAHIAHARKQMRRARCSSPTNKTVRPCSATADTLCYSRAS